MVRERVREPSCHRAENLRLISFVGSGWTSKGPGGGTRHADCTVHEFADRENARRSGEPHNRFSKAPTCHNPDDRIHRGTEQRQLVRRAMQRHPERPNVTPPNRPSLRAHRRGHRWPRFFTAFRYPPRTPQNDRNRPIVSSPRTILSQVPEVTWMNSNLKSPSESSSAGAVTMAMEMSYCQSTKEPHMHTDIDAQMARNKKATLIKEFTIMYIVMYV